MPWYVAQLFFASPKSCQSMLVRVRLRVCVCVRVPLTASAGIRPFRPLTQKLHIVLWSQNGTVNSLPDKFWLHNKKISATTTDQSVVEMGVSKRTKKFNKKNVRALCVCGRFVCTWCSIVKLMRFSPPCMLLTFSLHTSTKGSLSKSANNR